MERIYTHKKPSKYTLKNTIISYKKAKNVKTFKVVQNKIGVILIKMI